MSATRLAEYDSTAVEGDVRERWFVHGPGFPDPLVIVDLTSAGDAGAGTAEYLYYLKDMLGSVTALADDSGEVVERYVYDPYGRTSIVVVGFEREGMMLSGGSLSGFTLKPPPAVEVSRDLGRFGNPFAWTGQRYDKGVGLYHFLFRSYSPELGRWLQRDPLGYVDGANLQEYVAGNPANGVDPLGLKLKVGRDYSEDDNDDPTDDKEEDRDDRKLKKRVEDALKELVPSAKVDPETGEVEFDRAEEQKRGNMGPGTPGGILDSLRRGKTTDIIPLTPSLSMAALASLKLGGGVSR